MRRAAVEALVKGQKLPRFTRTMLSQAWTDVMALTALRQGADSPAWKRQLQVAERLIEISQHTAGDHPDSLDTDSNLQREIEQGLEKVGYQGEDIGAIAHRLVHPGQPSAKEDAGSRTELTMRLKAQARLGEDLPGQGGPDGTADLGRGGAAGEDQASAGRHLVRVRHQSRGRPRPPPSVLAEHGDRRRPVRQQAWPEECRVHT